MLVPIKILAVLLTLNCISHMSVNSQTVEALDALQPVWYVNPNPTTQQGQQVLNQGQGQGQTPDSSLPNPFQGQTLAPAQPQTLVPLPTPTPSLVPIEPQTVTHAAPFTPANGLAPAFTPTPAPAFTPAAPAFTLTPTPTFTPAPATAPVLTPFLTGQSQNLEENVCGVSQSEFYNLTRSVLERFCTVVSLTDLRALGETDIEACCSVDRAIVEDTCFDPCAEEENALDPTVILVDLWRAVCRIRKETCEETTAVQKAASGGTGTIIEGAIAGPPAGPPAVQPPPLSSTTPTDQISLSSIFDAVPGLSLLAQYLRNADLLRLLEDPGTVVTFFAPTNAAFTRFSQMYNIPLEDLESIPGWFEILLYHVVGGVQEVDQIPDSQLTPMTTAQGNTIMLLGSQSISSCCVQGNTAQILVPDTVVSNGMFHVINNLLLPFSVV